MTGILHASDGMGPPADINAEGKVLGALLLDDGRLLQQVPPKLTPKSFLSAAHGAIFESICDLRDANEPVRLETVASRMHDTKRLQMLKGESAYLLHLVSLTGIMAPSTFDFLVGSVVNKATLRDLRTVLAQAHARASDTSADPGVELATLEKQILGLTLNVHESGGLEHLSSALRSEIKSWHDRAMAKTSAGISTGFPSLDQYAGRLHPGDLLILGARPGMGKTSLVTSLATNVAKAGMATAIFSLEMPAGQIAARMLCSESGLHMSEVRNGRFGERGMTNARMALETLKVLDVYIDDASKGRPYVADIIARTRRTAAELARVGKKLGLVVVDYIQIVKLREELQKQRHDLAIGEVSIELKALAKELQTTVVACAQLNRGVESRTDKRPGMADLRDSGQIEQDADAVWLMYRDEYYNPDTPDKSVVEVLVEKNRHGEPGTVYLRFDGPTTSFGDDPLRNAR